MQLLKGTPLLSRAILLIGSVLVQLTSSAKLSTQRATRTRSNESLLKEASKSCLHKIISNQKASHIIHSILTSGNPGAVNPELINAFASALSVNNLAKVKKEADLPECLRKEKYSTIGKNQASEGDGNWYAKLIFTKVREGYENKDLIKHEDWFREFFEAIEFVYGHLQLTKSALRI